MLSTLTFLLASLFLPCSGAAIGFLLAWKIKQHLTWNKDEPWFAGIKNIAYALLLVALTFTFWRLLEIARTVPVNLRSPFAQVLYNITVFFHIAALQFGWFFGEWSMIRFTNRLASPRL